MQRQHKTLIILSPGFPANETDSTCMPFPQLFVRKLKELNPSLNIIVLAFQYPYTNNCYQWNNIKVYPFNGRNKAGFKRLLLWRSVWTQLKKIIDENEILGILNLWLGESAFMGKYAAKKYQLKNFTWLLGQDARQGNRYFRRIRPVAQNLVALSDFIAAEFYNNYHIKPAYIIPPGIDTQNSQPLPATRNIDIMGAGSLIELKQFNIFINVVAALIKKHPGIRAVICGDGPEKEKLQQLIVANDLSQHIQLMGEVSHAEVLAMMQSSRIFLHPSSYEGFATVISEALFAGAQVVSFCKPMSAGFKNQYIVQSETAMIDQVDVLLANKKINQERIITNEIENTCKDILALYENEV